MDSLYLGTRRLEEKGRGDKEGGRGTGGEGKGGAEEWGLEAEMGQSGEQGNQVGRDKHCPGVCPAPQWTLGRFCPVQDSKNLKLSYS